jgi:hypothetical protein
MTALVKILAYAFPANSSIKHGIPKQLAMFSGAALLVWILSKTYGLDLSAGFF